MPNRPKNFLIRSNSSASNALRQFRLAVQKFDMMHKRHGLLWLASANPDKSRNSVQKHAFFTLVCFGHTKSWCLLNETIMLSKNNFILAFLGVLVVGNSVLHGQHIESFDSTEPTWKLRDTDCVVPTNQWNAARVSSQKDSGRHEQIRYQCGNGTRILISHEIPQARVISELVPSVNVRSERGGVQLMVRVVLPNTPDEEDPSRPMKTLLKGPISVASRGWQNLTFADEEHDLQEKLERHLWVLRRKYGSHVSAQSAYIDLVVLNIYTSPGNQSIDIDDLKVEGIVSADPMNTLAAGSNVHFDPSVRPAAFVQQVGNSNSHVRRNGTVIEANGKPLFTRLIQHNGESFELLKSLGFNVIELRATASLDQLAEAKRVDVWLVCPPPPSVGLTSIDSLYDRVLAWSVGQGLGLRDLTEVQETVREIRESDLRSGRPIVANIESGWAQFSQIVDVLNVGFEPLGSSFNLSEYSDWIYRRSEVVGHNHPIWGDLQTEVSRGVRQQVSAMVGVSPPTPIEPQQLKYMAYEILSSGARGIRFRSRSRLDASDPSSRLRAKSLQWLNRHLAQIEPWIAGGVLLKSRNQSAQDVVITPIRTPRSQLLLIQRPTGKEQYYAGDLPLATVLFDNEGAPMSDRAYGILDHGLVPLNQRRDHVGARIQMDDCCHLGAVVLTQDPTIVTRLNQTYQGPGQTFVQMRTELVQQWLAVLQLIQSQSELEGQTIPAVNGALLEGSNALRKAESLINSSSPASAAKFLDVASQRLAVVRRELITAGMRQFRSKTSSPLLMHSSLVPLHWKLANQLAAMNWQPNSLPGGDFENLSHMTQNGWENRRLDVAGLQTKVELVRTAAVDGQYGLKMSVKGRPQNDLIESTPLWIATGRVPVKAGHMIRIHGWVKIDQAIQNSMDGLMIWDSLGGRDLAERIPVTPGWQEFAFYRAASTNTNVQVKFELTGIGEVLLDEVTIRAVELPEPMARQARKQ